MQLQGELQHRSCTGVPAVPRLSVTRRPHLLSLFIVFIISIINGIRKYDTIDALAVELPSTCVWELIETKSFRMAMVPQRC